MFNYFLILISLLFSLSSQASQYAKVRLVATKNSESAVLEFKVEKDWHIYYKYPGSFGEGPKLSNDMGLVKLNYPVPDRISNDEFEYFIYKNQVLFTTGMINKDFPFKLNYVVCKELCIPIDEEIHVKIVPDIEYKSIFKKAMVEIPNKGEDFKVQYYADKSNLYIITDSHVKDLIIHNESLITKQPKKLGNYKVFKVIYSKGTAKEAIEALESSKALVISNDKNSIVNLRLEITSGLPENDFYWFLLYALIGGFILNFMPCVLPILALKLRSINQKGSFKTSQIYTLLGIYTSFILLAVLTNALKSIGELAGWGIHFQNPYFIFIMIIITGAFGLSLLGVIKLQVPAFVYNVINKNQVGHFSHFLEGCLATLLATPCTAPFLGTAVGYALSQTYLDVYIFFIVIATGFSLPYFYMIIFNRPIIKLPNVGMISRVVNVALSSMLLATSLWLGFVLYSQVKAPSNIQQMKNIKWQKFSEEKIKASLEKGKIVIVDVTAAWCMTCHYNKFKVLENAEVINEIYKPKYVLLRGDITKQNPKINKYLQKNERLGVPFNAIYLAKDKPPIILPELLSVDRFLKELKVK